MACTIRTRYTELRLHVINVSPYRVNHMFNLIFMWFFVACLKYVLWVCQGHRRSPQIYTSCFSTPPPFAPCDCCAPGRKGRKSCCLKASNFNINFQAKKQWKVNIQFISVGRPTWVVNWILEAGVVEGSTYIDFDIEALNSKPWTLLNLSRDCELIRLNPSCSFNYVV